MDQRRRRRVCSTVVTVVLTLLLAACGSSDPEASKSFARRPETGLATRLELPPKYSGPGVSPWARDYTPSTSQYLDQFYAVKVQATIRAQLAEQGLREIVHTLWITDDQIQNDIVVLRFATGHGAAEQVNFAQTTNNGNGLLRSYTIDSPADPIVYYTDQPVAKGLLQAKSYAQFGPYVIEMFTFAPNSIPRLQINRWMRAQVTLLG